MVFIAARGNGKPYLTLEKFLEELEHEQEETRLRAQRLAAAIDCGEMENPADISFEEVSDEHRFSGLIDE